MKLSTGILAALATTGDAAITCAGTTELFEVECDATTGFTIVVNEACRGSFFTMVDFANSFVWKDSSVTAMLDPIASPATANEVVAGGTCVDSSSNNISMKPAATGVTDSSANAAFGWKTVPLSCATATQVASTSGSNEYVKYELYWNSNFKFDSASQTMYQLGQVKFTCRIPGGFQEDATGVVTISEDTAVTDPNDKFVDLAAGLELKINKAVFDGGSPKDETSFSAVAVNADAATAVYGQASISYTDATTADLGDYMELKLQNAGSSSVLTDFAVSLTKCWASTNEMAASDDTGVSGGTNYFDDTSTVGGGVGEFLFWDSFCSKYPSWVGPNPASVTGGYLKETWEGASSLHAVHFRQFGFNTEQASYAGAGSDIYYHCFIKVCDKASATTCSTTTLTGATRTCSATTYTGPSARRRRQAEEAEAEANATEINTPVIEVPTAECGAEPTVCDVTNAAVEAVEAAADAAIDAMNQAIVDLAETESAAAHATIGIAALTLAILN